MDNIYILQNEIENLVNKIGSDMGMNDDEKILSLQLALLTCYKVKNTRNSYKTKIMNKEEEAHGDSNETR